ncbi:retrovirus-related pol polyprotein from transposon TNT 1-94 [Tanacetum coccineum]
MKNNSVCKENGSNVFRKEREQYHEIQDLKAQMQDKNIAISELKKLIEMFKRKGVDTNFEQPSILGKPPVQSIRNQPVRFASQVDVSNKLTKPATPHSWHQMKESSLAKPNDLIAPGPSRNCPKHVSHQSPREKVGSNDMCLYSANHDECVLEYLSRLNPRASAQNKDAKSHKTTKRYMPVEKSSASKKPERQIPKGHRFSIKNTSVVHKKTMTPRSCLRWKPTGRIFKTIGLRWVPTGKIFAFSTNKVDSEPPNGSKEDITNQCESEQALDVSAGTLLSTADQASVFMAMTSVHISSGLVLHQMTSDHNRSELRIHDHSNEQSSSKLVPKVVPLAVKTATSQTRIMPTKIELTLEQSQQGVSNDVLVTRDHNSSTHTFINTSRHLESTHALTKALQDESWVEAMQEELLQFKLQKVWILVDLNSGKKAIGTKWVFKNKSDERSIVVKNKARLVAQWFRQEEGIDYDEVFALVTMIEAFRLYLAFASYMGFTVYQMDVKSAFLYGTIEEEVHGHSHPPGALLILLIKTKFIKGPDARGNPQTLPHLLMPILDSHSRSSGGNHGCKKVLEEEAESDVESEGVDKAERKFDQLAKDKEIARKVQEDWEAEEELKEVSDRKASLQRACSLYKI